MRDGSTLCGGLQVPWRQLQARKAMELGQDVGKLMLVRRRKQ